MLVRPCSDTAQQHQREQRDERMWMPHPIERVKRDAMTGTSGVLCESSRIRKHGTSWTFDFPASNTMPAREGPENGKAEAQPVFSISGGAFSDLRKGHQFLKIRKPTKWPTGGGAFSDQGERKISGASVSNAFPSSDGLLKCHKCVSAAAASSGFARVQDRAATW